MHKSEEHVKSSLISKFEEADMRIPLHVLDSIDVLNCICVVISSDTDVIVTLLYHMKRFLNQGLKELWVRAGVGDTSRYIPIHVLHDRMGGDLCSVLPAVHSLTGCDITSKVGTKKSALKAHPEKVLKQFGVLPTLTSANVRDAEQYLVMVLRPKSEAVNFSEMRVETFHFTKSMSHQNLPPTSNGLLPHIKRSFYNTFNIIHALDASPVTLNPVDYGFVQDGDILTPETAWNTLDSRWTVICNCRACTKSTCACRTAEISCTNFCRCKIAPTNICKNPL